MHPLEEKGIQLSLELEHYYTSAHSLVPNWIEHTLQYLSHNPNPDREDEGELTRRLLAIPE